jgi:hypothetical protein
MAIPRENRPPESPRPIISLNQTGYTSERRNLGGAPVRVSLSRTFPFILLDIARFLR